MGDFFSLSFNACCTWNFSGFLVCILCVFSFIGNICAVFGFFMHFWAKVKHNFSRRSLQFSKPSLTNAFLYVWYWSFKISLNAFFAPFLNLQNFPLLINCALQWLTALVGFWLTDFLQILNGCPKTRNPSQYFHPSICFFHHLSCVQILS